MFAHLTNRGSESRSSHRRNKSDEQEKEEEPSGLRRKLSRTLLRSKAYNSASMESNSSRQVADLFRSESNSSDNSTITTPPQKPHPTTPPPLTPPQQAEFASATLTVPVFEEPRKAPTPPKRPPRRPSELSLPPGSPPKPDRLSPPPPIPQKSALRRSNATRQGEFTELRPLPLFTESGDGSPGPSLRSSSSKSSLEGRGSPQRKDSDGNGGTGLQRRPSKHRRDSSASSQSSRAGILARATTAPAGALFTLEGKSSSFSVVRNAFEQASSLPNRTSQAKKRSSGRSLDSHPGVVADRKKASQRLDAAADVRARLLNLDDTKRGSKISSDAIGKLSKVAGPDDAQTKMRKKKKGETMSMLLDAGFFPVEEFVYNQGNKAPRRPTSKDFRINLPPRLSFIDRSLPSTPGSAQQTPTELYHRSPTSPRTKSSYRRSSGLGRRPLSQISENEVNDSTVESVRNRQDSEAIPSGKLEAIPEDAAAAENTPPASGAQTPVATQIHLRGGSVVTVTPPELTAWKPTVYIYGPIKLLKPAIMPRKNSVASLEPFQESVDKLYQDALIIPRRRSDDAVVDDIVDFFDDFGFDLVAFEGDKLSVMDFDIEEMSPDPERYSTPPTDPPAASPVEVVIAKEMVEHVHPIIDMVVPPVENEDTLRKRGIARLSRSSAGSSIEIYSGRKESLTLGVGKRNSNASTGGLPLLPPPEESMLEAVLQPARSSVDASNRGRDSVSGHAMHSARQQGGGGRRDQGVEEIEGGSSWTAPKVELSRGASVRKSKNPVSKVRQLVATASTIL